ncbi:MAG TPA: glycosyl hydrolase family 65 protein, partial [Acidimicrobiales bacterium]|nr:glycosyl hydrolase family 65 protein [Acidimicrobiales bacterium]
KIPRGKFILHLKSGILERIVKDKAGKDIFHTWRLSCIARPGIMLLLATARPGLLVGNPDSEGGFGSEYRSGRVVSNLGGGIAFGFESVLETKSTGKPGFGFKNGGNVERPENSEQSVPGGKQPQGVDDQFTRIAAYESTTQRRPSLSRVRTRVGDAGREGRSGLIVEHLREWSERWDSADIEIEGDPAFTADIRFALFHLMSTAVEHGESALGARGLTGDAYLGHVFWDADVFVLPFVAATNPRAAKSMLDYRISRLDSARESAKSMGRSGARFPWESASTGVDVTPRFGHDSNGKLVPIMSGISEEHITADIPWAAWQFAAWTGNYEFLVSEGLPLFVETARYWMDRSELDCNGVGHIKGVVGPDEYHESVDDNSFTNFMAAWNLRKAADLLDIVRNSSARDGTSTSTSHQTIAFEIACRAAASRYLDDSEEAAWRRRADSLNVGYQEASGLYEQFTGYYHLEELMAADLGTPPLAADLVAGRERIMGSQVIKQADTMMIFHLLPDEIDQGLLSTNLDFYLPRTSHGSSLSLPIHASLLARAGRSDDALRFLVQASRIDLDDMTGSTAGGLHLATLGGIWQAIVFGFAGIRPGAFFDGTRLVSDPVLTLDPHLPSTWRTLSLRLRWRGHPISFKIGHREVQIASEVPISIGYGSTGTIHIVPPGKRILLDESNND